MKKVQVFLQSEFLPDIEILEVDPGANADALHAQSLSKLPTQPTEPLFLFIEDEDDDHALEKLASIPEGLRLHLHRRKAIDVIVRYAGRDVRRSFRPSTTVGRVKKWATHELHIPGSDASELMLQVSGTNDRPDADIHIGTLAKGPDTVLVFDLVPSPRVNG